MFYLRRQSAIYFETLLQLGTTTAVEWIEAVLLEPIGIGIYSVDEEIFICLCFYRFKQEQHRF